MKIGLNKNNSKKFPWWTWHVQRVAIEDFYNSKQENMNSDKMEDDEYMTQQQAWCNEATEFKFLTNLLQKSQT